MVTFLVIYAFASTGVIAGIVCSRLMTVKRRKELSRNEEQVVAAIVACSYINLEHLASRLWYMKTPDLDQALASLIAQGAVDIEPSEGKPAYRMTEGSDVYAIQRTT